MSMQILNIFLYNVSGEIRALKFNPGKVNVITGKSDTGKSAIIPIIEYCLGQSDFEVPAGVIRNTVAWFAVLYQINDTQLIVAKPTPLPGVKSQSQVFYKIGSKLSPPPLSEFAFNSNDDAIVNLMSGLLGIGSNETMTGVGKSADAFEATLRHTTYYLFQQNDVIASKHLLFHKQTAVEWAPRTIKSTLPYFLGAIQRDRLQLEGKLYEEKRKLRSKERQLKEIVSVASDRMDRGRSLLAEAQQVGIVPSDFAPPDVNELIEKLKETQTWLPSELPVLDENQAKLIDQEIQDLRKEHKLKQEQIDAVVKFSRDADGYSSEAEHQKLRLEAINIFEKNIPSKCPICNSDLEDDIPSIDMINQSLHHLSSNLQNVNRERPQLDKYIKDLRKEMETIGTKIEEKRIALKALEIEDERAGQLRDLNDRTARIVGRISFYLEHVELAEETAPLVNEIRNIQSVVDHLEGKLDISLVERAQESALNTIRFWMTEWAKKLHLEYSEDYTYAFDLDNLTVWADVPGQPVPLALMGGGGNILGCHLITLFGLQKYFIKHKSPVPNFIILDQPAQIYFVSEEEYKSIEGKPNELGRSDRGKIAQLFKFLQDVVTELSPNLQLIVLEHVNLGSDDFRNILVEDPWTETSALIPQSWIDQIPSETDQK